MTAPDGNPRTTDGAARGSPVSRGSFAHGAALATVLLAARMACQAAVLVGVARVIQADGYGEFAAMVALASLFAPLAGLGTDFVAMRTVAQQPELTRAAFRRALVYTLLSAPPLMLVAGLLAWLAFGERTSLELVAAVLLADVLMQRVCELVAKVFQGRELIFQMGMVRLLPAVCRLLAVGSFLLLPLAHTPGNWALLYLVASVGAAALAAGWLAWEQRDTGPAPALERFRWQDGLHFAGGVMSVRLHTEADKSLVLSLSGATGAGVYAAAYRAIEFLLIPVGALVAVAYGRLFTLEHRVGVGSAAATGLRFTLLSLALAILIAGLVWTLLAPTLIWAVGPSFADVARGLPALSLLPLAMSLRMTGEQNMAAIARLRLRSQIQWAAAACALAGNLLLIPRAGWVGAVWVCVAVEAVLGLSYLTAVLAARRKHDPRRMLRA